MKILFGIFVFFCASFSVFAEDSNILYGAISPSVLYLAHEVYFNAAKTHHSDLWVRAGKINKTTYLDSWLPLMSGSGFYIDGNGTMITNRHVARAGNLKLLRENAIPFYSRMLHYTLGVTFSNDEIKSMVADITEILRTGTYQFSAYQNDRAMGSVQVLALADINDPDLAIVKIDTTGTSRLRLADVSLLQPELVGTPVFSFGYPLGFTLDAYFKQRVVTMNQGQVSAFRKTDFNVQHTAAISHGNSGGPLVNKFGVVIGVNSMIFDEKANSLYYAIGSDLVQAFLKQNGFAQMVTDNLRPLPGDLRQDGISYNAAGEIESAATILIDGLAGAEVILNGVTAGKVPVILKLSNPLSNLEVRTADGRFTGKLRLNDTLNGTTAISPIIKVDTIAFRLESSPPGASAMIDGQMAGTTPCTADLAPGNYMVTYRLAGYYFPSKSVVVIRNANTVYHASGQVAGTLKLTNLEGPQKTFSVFRKNAEEFSFDANSQIILPTGAWSMTIPENPAYKDVEIPVVIREGDQELDLSRFANMQELTLNGLVPDSRVWIDRRLQDLHGQNVAVVPLGFHSIFIWADGLQPFYQEKFEVTNPTSANIIFNHNTSHATGATILTISAVSLGLAGIISASYGLSNSSDATAIANTSSYAGYLNYRNEMTGFSIAGIASAAIAIVLGIIAADESSKYNDDLELLNTMENRK